MRRSIIAVTGATGFIGSHLLAGLLERGHEVIALHRRAASDKLPQRERLQWISLDDAASAFAKFPPQAVLHLATCYGRSEPLTQVLQANVGMPLRLLELAAHHRCTLFVTTDSFFAKPRFAYGHMRAYIQSKRQFLDWAGLALEGTPALKVVNARLEHVYGPGDGQAKFVPMMISKLLKNEALPLTPGEQMRDFVYVDDVVAAYSAIIDAREQLPVGLTHIEVGTGTRESLRSFVELAKLHAGSSSHLYFGALPYRTSEIMSSCADTSALTALGWAPAHSLDAGIRASIEAMRLNT